MFRIDKTKGRGARRDHDLFYSQIGRGPHDVVGGGHVISEGLRIGCEIGRLIGAQMDNPVSVLKSLEEIAGLAQVGKPACTQLLARRNFVEAKNLVTMREQLANDKLSQPAAAARNNDFFHVESI